MKKTIKLIAIFMMFILLSSSVQASSPMQLINSLETEIQEADTTMKETQEINNINEYETTTQDILQEMEKEIEIQEQQSDITGVSTMAMKVITLIRNILIISMIFIFI